MNFQRIEQLVEILQQIDMPLEELIRILDDKIRNDILIKENAELKEALMRFADDLATFQTLVQTSMSESRRQSSELIEKNSEMLNEKIASLLSSNQQLEKCLTSEIQKFAAAMSDLADGQHHRLEKVAQDIEAAFRLYIGKARTDLKEIHEEHERHMRVLKGKNVVQILYLAITPALVAFEFVARHFGWF